MKEIELREKRERIGEKERIGGERKRMSQKQRPTFYPLYFFFSPSFFFFISTFWYSLSLSLEVLRRKERDEEGKRREEKERERGTCSWPDYPIIHGHDLLFFHFLPPSFSFLPSFPLRIFLPLNSFSLEKRERGRERISWPLIMTLTPSPFFETFHNFFPIQSLSLHRILFFSFFLSLSLFLSISFSVEFWFWHLLFMFLFLSGLWEKRGKGRKTRRKRKERKER